MNERMYYFSKLMKIFLLHTLKNNAQFLTFFIISLLLTLCMLLNSLYIYSPKGNRLGGGVTQRFHWAVAPYSTTNPFV